MPPNLADAIVGLSGKNAGVSVATSHITITVQTVSAQRTGFVGSSRAVSEAATLPPRTTASSGVLNLDIHALGLP